MWPPSEEKGAMSSEVTSQGLMVIFREGQGQLESDFPTSAVFLKAKMSEFGYQGLYLIMSMICRHTEKPKTA